MTKTTKYINLSEDTLENQNKRIGAALNLLNSTAHVRTKGLSLNTALNELEDQYYLDQNKSCTILNNTMNLDLLCVTLDDKEEEETKTLNDEELKVFFDEKKKLLENSIEYRDLLSLIKGNFKYPIELENFTIRSRFIAFNEQNKTFMQNFYIKIKENNSLETIDGKIKTKFIPTGHRMLVEEDVIEPELKNPNGLVISKPAKEYFFGTVLAVGDDVVDKTKTPYKAGDRVMFMRSATIKPTYINKKNKEVYILENERHLLLDATMVVMKINK
ncbi:MAG: hypothetical protein RLZZ418_953 [Pseudomonadota bacterium]